MAKDINYVKTGEGTSAATVGFENGPFQKWQVQPNQPADAGYPSAFDQTETEIFSELIPDVVFGGWREHRTNNNVVTFPRGELYQEDDFNDTYTLTEPLALQGRKGEIDTVFLSHTILLGVIFQNFELESSNANRIGFEYREAVKGLARKFETQTIIDLIKGGLSAQANLKKHEDGSVDIYETFLAMRTQLAEQGNDLSNVDVYCTPDIVNDIMRDPHYISNMGNSSDIAAREVRYGFTGWLLGFPVYQSGRLSKLNTTGKLPSKANLFFIDNTQIILCRKVVQPIALKPAPSTYIDSSILCALEYFKHYIVNNYSVLYLDTTAE